MTVTTTCYSTNVSWMKPKVGTAATRLTEETMSMKVSAETKARLENNMANELFVLRYVMCR